MNQWDRRKVIVFGAASISGILLTLVVGLHLSLSSGNVYGNVNGVPPHDAWKTKYRGTHLDFIAETGRVIVNERGFRQIVWDPPQLPTLEKSIRMGTLAKLVRNPDLLPLCTEEYLHFLKEKKEAAGIKSHPPSHSFPACHAIPDAIYQGGLPSRPGFDKDRLGD